MKTSRLAFSAAVLAGALMLAGAVPSAHAQPPRQHIAFADFERVFTNYFKTKLAYDQLQQMIDSMNRERAVMLVQFDQTQEEIKSMRTLLSQPETESGQHAQTRKRIDAALVELRKLEDRIKKFGENQAKREDEQRRRIRDTMTREIRGRMQEFARTRGYTAVVDASQVDSRGMPAVYYLDPAADITADIETEINK